MIEYQTASMGAVFLTSEAATSEIEVHTVTPPSGYVWRWDVLDDVRLNRPIAGAAVESWDSELFVEVRNSGTGAALGRFATYWSGYGSTPGATLAVEVNATGDGSTLGGGVIRATWKGLDAGQMVQAGSDAFTIPPGVVGLSVVVGLVNTGESSVPLAEAANIEVRTGASTMRYPSAV